MRDHLRGIAVPGLRNRWSLFAGRVPQLVLCFNAQLLIGFMAALKTENSVNIASLGLCSTHAGERTIK
eukprot:6176376-Pleurochrysis_carterae.AAC.3